MAQKYFWVTERLSERGVDFRHSHGDEMQLCCPRCDDSSHHLYLNLNKGLWVCFRCNEKGGFLAFLKLFGLDPNAIRPRKLRQESKPAPPPERWPESVKIQPGSRAYEYLTNGRAIVDGKKVRSALQDLDIFRWNLEVGKEWPWDSYIFWPVHDLQNRRIAMHLRRFQFDGPRALNEPKGIDKTLLGAELPYYFPCDAIAITEGPYDAAHVTRELLRDNILGMALMGHSITPLQLLQLRNLGFPILVMLDADAWDAAVKMAREVSRWVPAYPVKLPAGDPDEYHRKDLLGFIGKALAGATRSPQDQRGVVTP